MHPSSPSSVRGLGALAAIAAAALTLTACAGATPSGDATGTNETAFPVTISNCGHDVTIEHAPQRIVMVNTDQLSNLEAFDAVDRIVAITTPPAPGLYEASTYAAMGALQTLATEKNATGGAVVSLESILGARPDLVIAPEKAVDRAALAAAGVPLYSPSAYCTDPPAAYTQTATFDRVWTELTTFGQVLGEPEKAASVIAQAKASVQRGDVRDAGTAAALYVSSGGTVLSPYGGPSMVTPVFQAAGLRNVYADEPQRVFDAGIEAIAARDPQTIVLLYSSDDADAVKAAFLSMPGVGGLTAVQKGRVVMLPFSYTDPPSILSTRGPAALADTLAGLG